MRQLIRIAIADWETPPDDNNFLYFRYRIFPRGRNIDHLPAKIQEIYRTMTPDETMKFDGYADLVKSTQPRISKRRLGPLLNAALPEWLRKAIDENERIASAAVLTRRYCKAILFSDYAISDSSAARGMMWLYLEELHIGRKTLPEHRHVITLAEAAMAPPICYYGGHRVGNPRVDGVNSPAVAKELFEEFTGGILDGIDWTDTYVSGSCIDYCCAVRSQDMREKAFKDADIDIFIEILPHANVPSLLDRAKAIFAVVGEHDPTAVMSTVKFANGMAKYAITTSSRDIEIYYSRFGVVVGYHLPSVRGWCQDGEFRMTISAALTYQTGVIPEYRWVKGHDYLLARILKAIRRGYAIMMSAPELGIFKQYCRVADDLIGFYDRSRGAWPMFHYNHLRSIDQSELPKPRANRQ